VSVYALLSIAWGVGALLGPLVGGLAMEISPHGLPVFAAIACGLFAIFASLDRPVARTVSR
jgi:MFS family permease